MLDYVSCKRIDLFRQNINASSHDLSHSEMGFYQSVPQYETFVENCAFNIPMTKSAQSDTEKFDMSLPLKDHRSRR